MRCLTSARFNMFADVLKQGQNAPPPDNPEYGQWVEQQDPLTHEIIRVWQPFEVTPDNPATPEDETSFLTVPCIARGIVDGGIRVAGTTERWGELYENVDYVRMVFPPNFVITKRDRITNIRNRKGQILWKDEETDPTATSGWRSTIFEVMGVTPVPDPWGNHIENVAMLSRAEVYA